MNTYILLRNNNESRPLSIEDLQQMGLKPTDLIWVECQSVCWEHPHEIKELRSLMVNAGADNNVNPVTLPTIVNEPVIQGNSPRLDEEKPITEISVAKPVSDKQEPISNPTAFANTTDIYKYAGISNLVAPVIEKKPDDITINSNYLSDELKEIPVKKTVEKKAIQQRQLKTRISGQYKKAALYAALVGAGALLMLLIKNNNGNNLPPTQNQPNPDNAITSAVLNDSADLDIANAIQDTSVIEAAPLAIIEENNSIQPAKKISTPDKPDESLTVKNVENRAIEKSTPPVDEIPVSKKDRTENLSSQVSVKANDYGVGSFGGIKNLEMTLQNDSKYVLDMVTVELKYLNPEGITLKTENIHFKSVQPGTQEKVAVSKSKRGVKIAYAITKIESKETITTTAGL